MNNMIYESLLLAVILFATPLVLELKEWFSLGNCNYLHFKIVNE